jgi:hypothetical protein
MTNEIVYRFGIREVVWSVYSAMQRRELGARSIAIDTQCSWCDAVNWAVHGELEGNTHPQMASYLAMLG